MRANEVIKKLNKLDLWVDLAGSGHYKVYNAQGNYITSFSATPGDSRWYHNLVSNLREAGYDLKERKVQSKNQEELAINLREFLRAYRDELKRQASAFGEYSERRQFARIAMTEVASTTGARSWKSLNSGEQAIGRILGGGGITLWAEDLIAKTMQYIDNDWSRPEPAPEPQSLKVADLDLDETVDTFTKNSDLTKRYAKALLAMLEKGVDDPDALVQILDRLDKLVL